MLTGMTLLGFRLLPAGAVAGWDFAPTGKRRLSTAHAMTGLYEPESTRTI
jgi:hypothetical protein